jgi:NTP pyrophosphatase (non-canonical NTP hydrolase)
MSDLNSYQEFASNYAIYHGGRQEELMYLALGLSGEAGEVAEKVKKYYRDDELDEPGLAKELGDVLWYLSQISKWLGYDFHEIADINLAKLHDRYTRKVLAGNGDNR